MIFASHNFNTITKVCDLMEKNGELKNVWVAQLLGMSEHASLYSSKSVIIIINTQGVKTAKYLPYGTPHIMMPYLIRRAEETSIVRGLQMQNNYLNKEFRTRFKL